MAIDLENYRKQKEDGLVSLAKLGDAYAVSSKRFDPATGKEIKPAEIAGVDLESIDKRIAALQGQIDNLNALKKDLEAL